MKTYVLYHFQCVDGFGAALAFYLEYGKEATYIPVQHGDPFPSIELNQLTNVYIVDFSYSRQILKELSLKVNKLVILDHHRSAMDDLKGLQEELQMEQALGDQHIINFDMEHSGTVLAFRHLFPKIHIPMLFKYIEDKDLWKFELTKSKEVNAALETYPFDFEVWKGLINETDRLAKEGEICLRFKNKIVEDICQNHGWAIVSLYPGLDASVEPSGTKIELNYEGYCVPCANASYAWSEAGNKLLEIYPESPFVLYYFDRIKDGKRQYGIRARKDFDAIPIAKAFGGGGHPQACGFQVKLPNRYFE
ncbi:MAG: hypothetical protein AABY22_16970 [Nanoarchaeota archaeon]